MTSFSSKKDIENGMRNSDPEEWVNAAFEGNEEDPEKNGISVIEVGEPEHINDSRKRSGSTYNPEQENAEKSHSSNREPQIGEELDIQENKVVSCIVTPIQYAGSLFREHGDIVKKVLIVAFIIFYLAYMIAALILDFDRAIALLVIFCLVLFFQAFALVRDHWGGEIWELWKPVHNAIAKNIYWLKWVFIAVWLGLLIAWIAVDTAKRPQQLISLAGYVVFVFLLWILGSKYPAKVRWRPVFWGLGFQLVFGVLILRTQAGFDAFSWLGNLAQTFLDYVEAGSIFLFGKLYYQHFFAMKVLPIIIYFSSFISVMYYLGAMNWLIFKMAWLMQLTLGTSATESMCAAGNIFVGLTESPLLIRPYIKDLTTSEMFAVMTAGFGTIAGSVLGAYLGFGIKAVYVITACFMAAPCSLAVAKLMYPETKKSKFTTVEGLKLDPPDQRNIVEAAFVGASSALPLVLNIGANLIAFISILAAINGFLGWYGNLLDFPQLSFELICSYVFLPITYMMGIEWQDCFKCAELLGMKIFLNEFIAYKELAKMIENKDNGTIPREDDEGVINWISDRSEAIITYALCGFANIGSIGIMLGGLTTMCPERQSEMTKIVIRALIGGIFVSLLNACVAGFFYLPKPDCSSIFSYSTWNYTEIGNIYMCCTEVTTSDAVTPSDLTEYCRCCNYDWETKGFEQLTCETTCLDTALLY